MGMRPNSAALSEMGSHPGGRSFHLSAKNGEFADGIEKFVAYSMSTEVCTDGAIYTSIFLVVIYFLLFTQNSLTHGQDNQNISANG
jgi:hypothetical protein